MGNLLDNINSIYKDYNPAFNNLYQIEIFPGGNTTEPIQFVQNYIKFHATSISFNGDSLNLTRNDITKNFQLSDGERYQRTNEISITWRESDNWMVKKYHEDWISNFYYRDGDHFWSYPLREDEKINFINEYIDNTGSVKKSTPDEYVNKHICKKDLSRSIRIYLPQHTNNGTDWGHYLLLDYVYPKTTGNVSLNWGSSSDVISHQMTYYVKEWKWGIGEPTSLEVNN